MRRAAGYYSFAAQRGFTLLEVMIVLAILGFLAAMIVPGIGLVDDLERERRTRQRMDQIRDAILGPEGRFDEQGRPVIGGYVGDMRAWPDLWEARAEIRPSSGAKWDSEHTISGYEAGQGPGYAMEPRHVFFRPSGTFSGGRWKWHTPYRKLYNHPADHDHVGGLETENEGQPRGLWTRYVEDLPFDLGTHKAPGEVLGESWKGPYLTPPQEGKPADSDHWATDDGMYANLKPRWETSLNNATWEDGDYDPLTGELGEFYDEKENFRLLQTADRLADGWDRALRFFITADPDSPGHTIFWILSEGADRDGYYPNKGGRASRGYNTWTVDSDNIMSKAYDPDHPKNRDNIVMKLHSRDWEGIFDAEDARKTAETEDLLDRIRRALIGDGPLGLNTGYTGDMAAWPDLFRWEDNGTLADPSDDFWDNADDSDTPYTKGQPRGLWTDRPGLAEDDLDAARFGLGWRHPYIAAPFGAGANNVLRDAWNREFLFFKDEANDALLVLSRGPDGKFTFGADANASEPTYFTEAVDVTGYDPLEASNADNRHLIVRGSHWRQGFFELQRFTVLNADTTTTARFFASAQAPVDGVDTLNATTLVDADGDLYLDDWVQGNATTLPAIAYPNLLGTNATTGGRCLVFWNDTDANGEPDTGERGLVLIIPVTAAPGSGQKAGLSIDASTFEPLP